MKTLFTRFLFLLLAMGLFLPDGNAIVPLKAPTSTEPDAATVKAAISQFSHLSAKEKKAKLKEVKKAVKAFKAQKARKEPVAGQVLQVIFAILIPPLGVYLHEGEINKRFWIDLLLTLLFFLPGMIYALVVVLGAA